MHAVFSGPVQLGSGTATDAWFRNMESISLQLTAAGFPKTADTGQVDWATVIAPAPDEFTAYEIRRFDDADQASSPIFMKIEYYYTRISTTSCNPRLRFSFGTGSDGAGNLTGVVGSTYPVNLSTTVTNRPYLIGSDGSGFGILANKVNDSTNGIARYWFGIERARDADGNTVPRYLMLYYTVSAAPTTTPLLNEPSLRVFDFELDAVITFPSIPVHYWQDLSVYGRTLAQGLAYPFGVIQFPVEGQILRNKMTVGYAQTDFNDETVVPVPRFSTGTLIPYRCEYKDGTAQTLGLFGMAPSGVGTTFSDHPAAFAMPAIYWD